MASPLEIPDSNHPSPPRPLFVLSVWRAGSSLLYSLLNQHPQVSLLYEADLPLLQPFFRGRLRHNDWLRRWEFWNQSLSRHNISAASVPTGLNNAWDATRSVYQTVAARKQASFWGEKTPNCHDRVLLLARQFPDARFIVIWRDLTAVGRSMMNAAAGGDAFFRKRGMLHRAILGCEKLKQSCETLTAQGRLVHELDYEDLTTDASECMRGVCRFLELPFDPNVASLAGADRSAIFAGEHHHMVRSDVIDGKRKSASPLPPPTQAKLQRYIGRWRAHYAGAWPKYPSQLIPGVRPPRLLEILTDRLIHRALRSFDRMTVMIYSVAPLSLLQLYRSRRGRNLAVGLEQPQGERS